MRSLVLLSLLLTGCAAPVDPEPTPPPSADTDDASLPLFCPDVAADVSGNGPWVVETEHYRIEVGATWTRDEADELGRLAESSWFAFEDYFEGPAEASDGELLDVVLSDTTADWEATIAADGLEVPFGAGGYFHPTTERAYLYRQPTTYYSRVLLLHEMAHQYHRLARESVADAGWYVEGVAEFLGRHDWDGECLRLGVIPLGTLEDFPARALTRWEQGVALDDVSAALTDVGRPLSAALYRFLEFHPDLHAPFHAFRAAIDAGVEDEGAEFVETVGSLVEREDEFGAWLRGEQNPMTPVYLEWLHVGPQAIYGFADGVVSFARLKETPEVYEQTVRPEAGAGVAGAVVEFDDNGHYTALLVRPDGGIAAFEVDDSGAFWRDGGSVDAPGASFRWTHTFEGDEVVVTVDGQEIRRPLRFTPAAGPALEDSDVMFEGIERTW